MHRLVRAVLCVLALATAAAAADDVVVLSNGREIRGKVVEETPDGVKVDLGFGTMTYRRAQIREVRRSGPPAAPEATAPGASSALAAKREECAVVYVNGERRGTRSFRVASLPDGWSFEEEVRTFDEKGAVRLEVRTEERADRELRPMSFRVRESSAGGLPRSVSGEVVAGVLHLTFAKAGDREKRDVQLPDGAKFPFAARESFLRESKALDGKLDASVYDPRDGVVRTHSYREGGSRPLRMEGKSLEARVVLRKRGDVSEREWLAPDGTAALAELDGPGTVAIAAGRAAVERLRSGDADAVTGPDSAARTVYADPVRGFRIGKPDPTWTFEKPVAPGGALVTVSNEPVFASVDVMLDSAATPATRIADAAAALQRVCRLAAPDFTVVADGYDDRGGATVYWLDATATTKGEKTRTLARVVVKDGTVWRVLAACPAKAFASLRPDLETILDSFRAE